MTTHRKPVTIIKTEHFILVGEITVLSKPNKHTNKFCGERQSFLTLQQAVHRPTTVSNGNHFLILQIRMAEPLMAH